MTIDVDLAGRRYIEDRDTTAVLSGSQTRRVELHRALDARADRRRRPAVADRRRCRHRPCRPDRPPRATLARSASTGRRHDASASDAAALARARSVRSANMPNAATTKQVDGAEPEAGARAEGGHDRADDRAADRRRALEGDEPQRHHAAAHLRRRAQLQGRVAGRHERDARAADERQRDQLEPRGWARSPRASSRRRSRSRRAPAAQPGLAAGGDSEPADHRADAHRRGHEAEAGGADVQPVRRHDGQRHLELVGRGSRPARHHHQRQRQPGAAPDVAEPSRSWPLRARRRRHRVERRVSIRRSELTTATKLAALTRKQTPSADGRRSGARRPRGRPTRATLTSTELRLTALRRCSGPTSSSMNDCRAGFSNALLRPSSDGEHADLPDVHRAGDGQQPRGSAPARPSPPAARSSAGACRRGRRSRRRTGRAAAPAASAARRSRRASCPSA